MFLRTPVFLAFSASAVSVARADSSSKRGLVFVGGDSSDDASIWTSHKPDDITWYYNWAFEPSSEFSDSGYEFVPMLWGTDHTESFADTVKGQVNSGSTVSHVLGYNEPDGTSATGGSGVEVSTAVKYWMQEMEPLRRLGIKLGAPAVTGSDRGLQWLSSFFDQCAGQCHVDFIPLHWYGDFEGMASYIGQVRAAYQHVDLWVTEFALPEQDLEATQTFYNQSTSYLDSLDYVKRYSYFGAFRSDTSNVGPNSAMLTSDGKLTDIGSWYLGGKATGNIPSGAGSIVDGLGHMSRIAWLTVMAAAILLNS